MHILDEPRPCAACGRETIRTYGSKILPLCRACVLIRIRAHARAAEMSGRTWGSRWEVVMSALKAMATRGGIKLARIERGR